MNAWNGSELVLLVLQLRTTTEEEQRTHVLHGVRCSYLSSSQVGVDCNFDLVHWNVCNRMILLVIAVHQTTNDRLRLRLRLLLLLGSTGTSRRLLLLTVVVKCVGHVGRALRM